MDDGMRVNIRRLAGNLGVRPIQVRAAVRWLRAGYTVPYLAYYGRSRTGGLSEETLRQIARYLDEQARLAERKQSVLKHIEGQERLTAELRDSILRAEDASQLEELFFPFKQPQETPADQAHARGLSKLAEAVWVSDPIAEHLQDLLPTFVNPDVGLNTPEDVLEGVRHLLGERLAQMWQWRRVGRRALRSTAILVSRRHPDLPEDEGQEFRDWFDFREKVSRIRPHVVLALVRGERERALQLDFEFDPEAVRRALLDAFPISEHRHLELIRSAANEAIELYLIPSLVGELRRRLYQRAEDYASAVIAASLKRLVCVKPMPGYRVLAIDPGVRPGCRVAVLDESGAVLESQLLHLITGSRQAPRPAQEKASGPAHQPATAETNTASATQSDSPESSASQPVTPAASDADSASPSVEADGNSARPDDKAQTDTVTPVSQTGEAARPQVPDLEKLIELVQRHDVQVIVLGQNHYYREVEKLVQGLIAERLPHVQYSIVTDLGAAQYAGGMLGKEELPQLDAGLRLAVSLGGRFRDLLAEMVKVDLPSLAGLLNFSDITTRRAQEAVRHALESMVNWVGVDLNQASVSQLRYIAGLNEHLARVLVEYRRTKGPFRRREQLLEVPGITEAIYRQAAAFVRIPDGEEPLDSTWLHPEQYDLARRVLEAVGFSAEALKDPFRRRELRKALSQVEVNRLAEQLDCSAVALREVINHLAAAGRDPRWFLPGPVLRQRPVPVTEIRPGQHYYGQVVRWVDFGAFVDIGAEETGLVHKSRFGRTRFHSPREVVTVGEVVSVWVTQVDATQKRIGLSLVPPIRRRVRRVRRRRVVRPSPPVTMVVQPPSSSPAASRPEMAAAAVRADESPASTVVSESAAASAVPATPVSPPAPTPPPIVAKAPASVQPTVTASATPTESQSAAQPPASEPRVPGKPPEPKPAIRPVREPAPQLPPEVLAGKRDLRTFAELKAFFEARQRLQARSGSDDQTPANPAQAPSDADR